MRHLFLSHTNPERTWLIFSILSTFISMNGTNENQKGKRKKKQIPFDIILAVDLSRCKTASAKRWRKQRGREKGEERRKSTRMCSDALENEKYFWTKSDMEAVYVGERWRVYRGCVNYEMHRLYTVPSFDECSSEKLREMFIIGIVGPLRSLFLISNAWVRSSVRVWTTMFASVCFVHDTVQTCILVHWRSRNVLAAT